jgi:hypothetical protein
MQARKAPLPLVPLHDLAAFLKRAIWLARDNNGGDYAEFLKGIFNG